MAWPRADFIRNTFRVTLSDDGSMPVNSQNFAVSSTGNVGHYGADAAMAEDLMAYIAGDLAHLPLSCVDALEAGLTALAMDEAMRKSQVVDLAPTWKALDAALDPERNVA